MESVVVVGGGLAGSEAALLLAKNGIHVHLWEMRPQVETAVHKTGDFAELVCSNSLKSTKAHSAAGLLKEELAVLHSPVYETALHHAVPAGGALAVDRVGFSAEVTRLIEENPLIDVVRKEAKLVADVCGDCDAVILATGPLTSDALAQDLSARTGTSNLAFYDAAAPIVMADSLDAALVFSQNRYGDEDEKGDYLNIALNKECYCHFIEELLGAEKVILHDFETHELFQACQPIEEIARAGFDAPRYGAMKPVGIVDPTTGRRPWAVVQLRAENKEKTCYNLVGFQTNLTFAEQKRVFSLLPGLEHAEFARYGVMHRNTFLDAPRVLKPNLELSNAGMPCPLFVAGQLSGTEGYTEAIRSGMHAAFSAIASLKGLTLSAPSPNMVFGALLAYATNPETTAYQPSHVNFGLMPPLPEPIKQKEQRYQCYAQRANAALRAYAAELLEAGIVL